MPQPVGQPGRDPEVGTTLGGCKIVERVGQGGMGIVFRAEQLKLGRMVALKVPLAHLVLEDVTYNERLIREARIAAQLSHPNVVQVYDAGEENGRCYVVLEFVRGESLKDRISRKGKLAPGEALAITLQAAKGLAAAHQVGMIHRDIKPSNFLITQEGVVKLADFGLAKAVSGVSHMSTSSAVVGTPHYMSPEQCQGGEVDARADVYSLGVTLFEMLTGRRPFDADTGMAVMYKQIHEPVPADLDSNPAISPSLATLVRRAMAKRARERFQSVGDLIQALRPVVQEIKTRSGVIPVVPYIPPVQPQIPQVPQPIPQTPPVSSGQVAVAAEKVRRQWEESRRRARKRTIAWGSGLALGAVCLAVYLVVAAVTSGQGPRPARTYDELDRLSQELAKERKWDEAYDACQKALVAASGLIPPPKSYSAVEARMAECERHFSPDWAHMETKQIRAAWQEGIFPAMEINLDLGQKLRLVYIPAGEFQMGAGASEAGRKSDELPRHRVRITKSFHMGIHEVTLGQWLAVMGKAPSWFQTGLDYPVEQVGWQDCQEFVQKLNAMASRRVRFRLPTEAEWEYACRAGTTPVYPWGNSLAGIANYANFGDETARQRYVGLPPVPGENDEFEDTAPVGRFRPNAWGLYDLIGNVAEWCQDFYGESYYQAPPLDDPKGPPTGQLHVYRGGGWYSSPVDCRPAARQKDRADYTHNTLGLRLVCQ